MPKFLFVPSVARGNGTGHLVRCLRLSRELSGAPGSSAGVYVPEARGEDSWSASEIERAFPEEAGGVSIVRGLEEENGWDFVVLDRRSQDGETERRWRAVAPTIALDEGGEAFGSASMTIDILPRLNRTEHPRSALPRANLESPGYLDLPNRRREAVPSRIERVLVTFGGEDPADLGPQTARALAETGLFRNGSITLVSGALRKVPDSVPAGVTVRGPVANLREELASYDLVVTQFGLTAFEAAWARCAVLLVNPGPYHSALARRSGFPEAGIGRPDPDALTAFLGDPTHWADASVRAAPVRRESLSTRLAALKPGLSRGSCPVCGSLRRSALARYPRKSYFRCSECGMVYRELFEGRDEPYTTAYFFDEYKSQYGRTYLEDFPALTALAARRLDAIERLLPFRGAGARPSVLDVGCAYGAFLAEAARRGWDARGVDIAESAAQYVREKLKLAAVSGDFLDSGLRSALDVPVDCLTLWYVIEHFDRLAETLSAVARMVRPGGLFAFSTPSGRGVSARSDPTTFFERSPDDHATIWEPRRTAGILKRYGFRLERIRVTGHHPERFPGVLGGPFPRPATLAISRVLGLGDTFECYARRSPAVADREE